MSDHRLGTLRKSVQNFERYRTQFATARRRIISAQHRGTHIDPPRLLTDQRHQPRDEPAIAKTIRHIAQLRRIEFNAHAPTPDLGRRIYIQRQRKYIARRRSRSLALFLVSRRQVEIKVDRPR